MPEEKSVAEKITKEVKKGGKWIVEFVDDMPHVFKRKIGKGVATSLTGFVAGVVVTVIVLFPWMLFLSKACQGDTTLFPPFVGEREPEQAPAEAPLQPVEQVQ